MALTAIIVVRIQRRTAAATTAATTVRITAQSIIDLSLHKLAENANWRRNHTSGSWTAIAGIDSKNWAYMLEDEKDSLLENDPYDSVRLHVRAEVDGALRIYSVLLRPAEPVNLLSNGDMESGITNWAEYGTSCQLIACNSKFHTGKWSIGVVNRQDKNTAMITNLSPEDLTSGSSYQCEMQVMADDKDTNIKVKMVITSTVSGTKSFSFTKPVNEADKFWIKISGTLTPTWEGSITSAYLKVRDKETDENFYIDDASLKLDPNLAGLSVVAGTFRQEILGN